MTLRKIVSYLVFASFLLLSGRTTYVLLSEDNSDRLNQLKNEIEQYEKEIDKLKSQASTLLNQVAQYDTQIKLTTLRITQTQEQIDLLGGRIGQLEDSLQTLTTAFNSRVVHTYKMSKVSEPFFLLITATDLSEVFNSFQYLKKIQEADQDLMTRLENVQVTYKQEKTDQEALQEELEKQKNVLGAQKNAKANLLTQTKSDEKKYQQLLAQAKSEYEAIQAIVAGKGNEEEAGKVGQGSRIASIIQGASCNSSGSHLHFIVSQNGAVQNPFSYLQSIDFENCSGSSCGSSDGDPFNPGGSWNWPINAKVKFTQGYGYTWAIRNTWVGRIYNFHNGIDVDSSSGSEVKAVRAGTLYRGSYTGYNSCRLKYVRLDHDDSDLDTFYLHIDY